LERRQRRRRKTAFAIQRWADGGVVKVGIVERHQIPWHAEFWGKFLSREQALLSNWLPSVFQLMDKISCQDELLIAFWNEDRKLRGLERVSAPSASEAKAMFLGGKMLLWQAIYRQRRHARG
jgi:hypothetical protein